MNKVLLRKTIRGLKDFARIKLDAASRDVQSGKHSSAERSAREALEAINELIRRNTIAQS